MPHLKITWQNRLHEQLLSGINKSTAIYGPLCGRQNGRMDWPPDGRKRKMIWPFISDKKTSVIAVRKRERLKITITSRPILYDYVSVRTSAAVAALKVCAFPGVTGIHRGRAFVNIWEKKSHHLMDMDLLAWTTLQSSQSIYQIYSMYTVKPLL